MLKYYRISDPLDVRDLSAQMAAWQAAENPKAQEWAVQPAAPSADAVWTADATWIVPPAPTFTAEQHLESSGYGSLRLVALLDLEQKLLAAGKTSAAMSAARQWIDGILAAYATDPSPRSDWPQAPVSFEEAVSGAMQELTAP